MLRPRVFVMQPTSLCNLNCRYCYISEQSRRHAKKMDTATLEIALQKILAYPYLNQSILINWHAGEPLTAGMPFYEKACEYITQFNERGIEVEQSIQSNGILINSAWCEFFKRTGMGISLSIDGPAFIHDVNRVNWNNRGSHRRVMQAVQCLQDHGVPFYVLMVITEACLDHADAVFDFFVSHQIPAFGFNVEEMESHHDHSTLNQSHSVIERYQLFMERLIDLWMAHADVVDVREFTRLAGYLYHAQNNPDYAPYQIESSGEIFTIKSNGDVVLFSPELADGTHDDARYFAVGNLHHLNTLHDVYQHPKFKRFQHAIQQGIHQCQQSCDYFNVCGGGNPSNKYFENRSFATTETNYCRYYYQYLTDILIRKLTHSTMHTHEDQGMHQLIKSV